MLLFDTVALDGVRRTRDGYLVANAKIARTGIQTYMAGELGLTDMPADQVVRVYRPADEVFAADAMASMAYRPMTVDHPRELVTAANWREHSVGMAGGDVARDGDFIRVPLTLMDAGAIDDYEHGRRELSVGYTCDLVMEPGTAPDGQAYDAVQRTIRGNHIALCRTARGGPQLRLGDDEGDRTMPEVTTRPVVVDGITYQLSDQGAQLVERLRGLLDTSGKALETAQAQHTTALAAKDEEIKTKDAEIATLKKAVEDAKTTPAQLRDAAKAFARTVADAKVLAPDLTITDEMDAAGIKKAVVTAKLGDSAKDWSDAQFDVSFSTMAAAISDEQRQAQPDPLREVIRDGGGNANDASKAATDARTQMIKDLQEGKAAA